MKYPIQLVLALLFLGSCHNAPLKGSLERFEAIPGSESFTATLALDTLDLHYPAIKEIMVQIDSNGTLHPIRNIDSIPRNSYYFDIDDSTLLIESADQTALSYYNIVKHSEKKLLTGYGYPALSNNKKYLAITTPDYSPYNYRIYKLERDSLNFIGETSPYRIFYMFGDEQFLGYDFDEKNPNTYIIYPNLSIADSFLEHINYGVSLNLYSMAKNNELVFLRSSGESPNTEIVRYDIKSRIRDTLFSGMYFCSIIAMNDPRFYLLQGKTISQYKDEDIERSKFRTPPNTFIDYAPQRGYWIIGDSRTRRLKDIGYQDFQPVVSSSGRHILFYKRDGDDYRMKVVSVKELLED